MRTGIYNSRIASFIKRTVATIKKAKNDTDIAAAILAVYIFDHEIKHYLVKLHHK